jgi:myo-inositol-1(or 4)-monophosphatase
MDAYLQLTATMHRHALRFRCVGAASVLWAWLAGGQIQGMLLAHNNPYDVVAGHAIARAAGAICTDYAGAPLSLESDGAMAAVPGSSLSLLASPRTLPRQRETAEKSFGEAHGLTSDHDQVDSLQTR